MTVPQAIALWHRMDDVVTKLDDSEKMLPEQLLRILTGAHEIIHELEDKHKQFMDGVWNTKMHHKIDTFNDIIMSCSRVYVEKLGYDPAELDDFVEKLAEQVAQEESELN